MRARGVAGPVPEARLLLALQRRPPIAAAVAERLPGVPAVFLDESGPAEWRSVEAGLLGSVAREAPRWDPGDCPRLRFVQRVFTGVDDLPFDRFSPAVEIAGNVGGYAPFVAEHAVALALAAARLLVPAHAQVAAGRLRPPPENRLLWHRRVLILGFGEIGRGIAARLAGFGVRLSAVNRDGRPVAGVGTVLPASRLREALGSADVVFDARPLTRATAGSIGPEELRAMPPDGVYVNVGRAGVVDERALFEHLRATPSFRAGLDVWWEEEFATGTLALRYPFAELPNVVATPHSAAFGPGVLEHALGTALENLARFFAGERPRHLVDRREYAGAGGG